MESGIIKRINEIQLSWLTNNSTTVLRRGRNGRRNHYVANEILFKAIKQRKGHLLAFHLQLPLIKGLNLNTRVEDTLARGVSEFSANFERLREGLDAWPEV